MFIVKSEYIVHHFIQACPNEFKTVGAGCYFIESINKLPWTNAKLVCEENGAHLIKIDNLNEDEYIQHELSK